MTATTEQKNAYYKLSFLIGFIKTIQNFRAYLAILICIFLQTLSDKKKAAKCSLLPNEILILLTVL